MMKQLRIFFCLFLCCGFSSLSLLAQEIDSVSKTMVEQMPEFPGGADSLTRFIKANLVYPEPARAHRADATVTVSLLVNKDGSLSDFLVYKSTDWSLGFNEEAIRVLKKMPPWKPAKMNGLAFDMRFYLPVQFKLSEHPPQNAAPQFVGGPEVLTAFVAHEVRYPKKAQVDKIEGTVVVKAVIDTNGKVKSASIEKGLRKDCDREALRLVKHLSGFYPALAKGLRVEGVYMVSVPFTLSR